MSNATKDMQENNEKCNTVAMHTTAETNKCMTLSTLSIGSYGSLVYSLKPKLYLLPTISQTLLASRRPVLHPSVQSAQIRVPKICVILLMDEILHHLGALSYCNS